MVNIKKKKIFSAFVSIVLALGIATSFVAFSGAPKTEVGSGSVVTSSENGFKTTVKEVEDKLGVSDRYVKTSNFNVPSASDVVDVIVKLEGDCLVDFAASRGEKVKDVVATAAGRAEIKRLVALQNKAKAAMSRYVRDFGYSYTAVFNGFSASIIYKDIAELEACEYVESVVLSDTYSVPDAVEGITENIVDVYETGIYDSSSVGYDGTGTVVAVLDTGTDYTHDVFNMELDADTVAMDKDDVARVAASLTATALSAANDVDIDEDDLYMTSKLPYAYDYADKDPNVYPSEAHGTHVAGIIAGKSDVITGVAPKAQIATFKVFSDLKQGAEQEDIYAAINDAVILGVDAINMSLGSSCGFSREGDDDLANEAYDNVEKAGICLIVAASNDYSSAQGSPNGNTNLATNPDSGTVGSPATYPASVAVASVAGVKTKYMVADEADVIYFTESSKLGSTEHNDFIAGLLGSKTEASFDYVVVPGTGSDGQYAGIDVTGKIAVVKRGITSFEDKVKIAEAHGAIACIVYNNVSGTISMSVGTKDYIPSCSVSMDYGMILEGRGSGKIYFSVDQLAGPFMSDFSSWGVLPDLELKPDITAHGGEIYSSVPGKNEYDKFSGTSMACPNLCGAIVLVCQYVKENNPGFTTIETRDLAYSLLMSTATTVRNEDGNPYSPRKQGAGLADIGNSVKTAAYLSVDGSNKPKLSLGDDPDKTGVYGLEFYVTNMSGNALSYDINPIVMTESMSSDEKTVAEKPYLFNDVVKEYTATAVDGKAYISDNTLNIGGYAKAKVGVRISLSAADKQYIDELFKNGMYVEGFLRLESNDRDGVDLSLAYLAFYGDWAAAPILDVTAYEIGESKADTSVLEIDKLQPDVFGTLPYCGWETHDEFGNLDDAYYGLGAYTYILDDPDSAPITRERYASLTSNGEGNRELYAIAAGLIRGAKRVDMEIRDSLTGELIWEKPDYNARKSHSSGGDQTGGFVEVEFKPQEYGLSNNAKYTFSMACYLDWKDGTYGNRNTYSFEFTIDNEKPELVDTMVRHIVTDTGENYYYLDLSIYDNHYLQAYIPYTYEYINEAGDIQNYTSLISGVGVVPVYNGEYNGTTTLSLNITPYWDEIQKNGGKIFVEAIDYAKNSAEFEIVIEQETDVKVALKRGSSIKDSYTITENGQVDLNKSITVTTNTGDSYLEDYWIDGLVWESSDPSVVEVRNGVVTGLKEGLSVVTVRPKTARPESDPDGASVSFNITVKGHKDDITITGIKLSNSALSLERGEEVVVTATIEPYNYTVEMPEITWASSSAKIRVTPDPEDPLKATVKALDTASGTVTATVSRPRVQGTCNVRVVTEFVTDSVYLRSYKGRGDENGVVEIPDDLGIVYIYPSAFVNNKYIKKVIIPEGVQQIMYASFYGCDNLEEVVLPESLKEIGTWAFGWCTGLKKINLDNVGIIGWSSFYNCNKLESISLQKATYVKFRAFARCSSLTSVDFGKVGQIGDVAFYQCDGLTEIVLPEHTTVGEAAFAECANLETVKVYGGSLGTQAFFGCGSLSSVTFANDVDSIGDAAFYNCEALEKVDFLGTVYSIGARAFAFSGLTEFTVPAGLEVLGEFALAECRALTTIHIDADAKLTDKQTAALYGAIFVTDYTVDPDNKYLSVIDGVLYNKAGTTLLSYPTSKTANTFRVPSSVKKIGESAFFGNVFLSTVDITGVTEIEENAFSMSRIRTVRGYDSVRKIGDYAFAGADELVVLPVSAATEYIGISAFSQCESLPSTLVIPNGVEYIGQEAFAECPFASVSLGDIESIGTAAFVKCENLRTIDFGKLETIGDYAFSECPALTAVTIPASVKSIGMGAFAGAEKLASVTFAADSTVEYIPAEAFAGTAITSIALPSAVTEIGDYAFAETALSLIDLSKIVYIGDYAFKGAALESANAPKAIYVGNGAFYENKTLKTATLPAAVTLGAGAFKGASALASVTLGKVSMVYRYAFEDCEALASVDVESAIYIGEGAFKGASALASVTLGNAVYIGAYAFEDTAITSISLPASVEEVALKAFLGANKLTAITVAAGNETYSSENGVLYRKADNGYFTLVSYPAGKTDKEYTVKNRTVNIAAYAFNENKHIESITLPIHVRAIGAAAMFGTDGLKTLTINAVAAPTLESDPDEEGENVYNNIKSVIGEKHGVKIVVPKNNTGYDKYIWSRYSKDCIEATDAVNPIFGVINFADRVTALPSNITAADRTEIEILTKLYNTLNSEQKKFVTGGLDGHNYKNDLDAAAAKLPPVSDTPDPGIPEDPETPENPDGGCGSSFGAVGIAAIIATVFAAFTVVMTVRKRKNNNNSDVNGGK